MLWFTYGKVWVSITLLSFTIIFWFKLHNAWGTKTTGKDVSLPVVFMPTGGGDTKFLILGSHFRKEILMQGISPRSEPTSGTICDLFEPSL